MLLIWCQIYPWWRFLCGHWAAFLALFHNCLKQHRNMFNLICVLHIKNQTRFACQTISLSFPYFVGGLGSWDLYATRAVCIQSGSCHLEHGSMFPVVPCFSGIMTKETAEPWVDCRDMSWESCPESSAHMLWCWLTFADRGDHERSKELSSLCKFLFLSFVVSHFERLLFWSSLVRLLVPFACMPSHSPETCDWSCNSHWGCCHGFSLWNGGNVVLPHSSFLRICKMLLKRKEFTS